MLKTLHKYRVVSYFTTMLVTIFVTHFLLSTRHIHFVGASVYFENFLDSLLMTVISFPILYFFFLHPLTLEIKKRREKQIELEKAKERAEEANRLKSGFLSGMSHEIRTPLNAILGYSGLLKDYFYDTDDDEIKFFFNSIENGSLRLLDTITKILDISRIEAGEFPTDIHSISLNRLIDSAYQLLNNMAISKGLKIKLDFPTEKIHVLADEYCLNTVLVNVLNNAIKYSEKGEITIWAGIVGDKAEFKVKDEGIGMSEEYQKHLFETFSQEDVGMSRRYEGTGLGLALSKKYLDLISGEIKIESKQGVGTTVTIWLPVSNTCG